MKIYFVPDEKMRVIPYCDWNIEIIPRENWILGEIEDKAYNEIGIPLYKYENEQCVKRTQEEIQADIDEIPLLEPTETEMLRADVDFLTMENEFLEAELEQAKADIDYLLMMQGV